MSDIRTISLEFVRSGPSHNQLLSPMTRYLGLCGDFTAESVSVPHEHLHFMRQLRELQYTRRKDLDSEKRRRATLEQMGKEMGALLGRVPGLVAGVTDAQRVRRPLTHLELVMSAAELALLPSELSTVPPTCQGGAEGPLLLRSEAPICMTRRVREVSGEHVRWPSVPRILFVASSPGNLTIPLEQHIQVILKHVVPWMPVRPGETQSVAEAASKILRILPNASIDDVLEACRGVHYTHVHVLAHGMADEKSEERPIGLAMRGPGNSIDVVTGRRFAAALRATEQGSNKAQTSMPTVVTLATCDSGKMEDVVYSGASFAHAVHQASVPFVVASQFPLSFAGSVHMVDELYGGLLAGKDPRAAIHEARRRLYTLHAANTHDWASLVAYAALPPDLNEQLLEIRYRQVRSRINRELSRTDAIIRRVEATDEDDRDANGRQEEKDEHVREALKKVEETAEELPRIGAYATEAEGLRGATYKRIAETHFRMYRQQLKRHEILFRPACWQALCRSRNHYWLAVLENFQMSKSVRQIKASRHWAFVQYLCLGAALGDTLRPEHWYAAKASADFDTESPERQSQIEAHSSLAELYLLLLAYAAEDESKFGRRLLPRQPKTRVAKDEFKSEGRLLPGGRRARWRISNSGPPSILAPSWNWPRTRPATSSSTRPADSCVAMLTGGERRRSWTSCRTKTGKGGKRRTGATRRMGPFLWPNNCWICCRNRIGHEPWQALKPGAPNAAIMTAA